MFGAELLPVVKKQKNKKKWMKNCHSCEAYGAVVVHSSSKQAKISDVPQELILELVFL